MREVRATDGRPYEVGAPFFPFQYVGLSRR